MQSRVAGCREHYSEKRDCHVIFSQICVEDAATSSGVSVPQGDPCLAAWTGQNERLRRSVRLTLRRDRAILCANPDKPGLVTGPTRELVDASFNATKCPDFLRGDTSVLRRWRYGQASAAVASWTLQHRVTPGPKRPGPPGNHGSPQRNDCESGSTPKLRRRVPHLSYVGVPNHRWCAAVVRFAVNLGTVSTAGPGPIPDGGLFPHWFPTQRHSGAPTVT